MDIIQNNNFMKKILFYFSIFSLICCSSLQNPLLEKANKTKIQGDWGVTKIGDASCNFCPGISFYESGKGLRKSKELQENFHWKLLSDNQLEIQIKEEDSNTFTYRLLDEGTYYLISSKREYKDIIYEQVEIMKDDNIPICTIMRRAVP